MKKSFILINNKYKGCNILSLLVISNVKLNILKVVLILKLVITFKDLILIWKANRRNQKGLETKIDDLKSFY